MRSKYNHDYDYEYLSWAICLLKGPELLNLNVSQMFWRRTEILRQDFRLPHQQKTKLNITMIPVMVEIRILQNLLDLKFNHPEIGLTPNTDENPCKMMLKPQSATM